MDTLRTIQRITGPTLTIELPAGFAGKDVEVTVQALETPGEPLPPEKDPRYARFIMPKPPLTEEQKKEFERNPYPLRGTGGEYIDPYEPAVPPDDWEACREDAEVDPHDPA